MQSPLYRSFLSLSLATLALGATALVGMSGPQRPPERTVSPPQKTPSRQNTSDNQKTPPAPSGIIPFRGSYQQTTLLSEGQAVEISVHLERPSLLPPNARIAVEWTLEQQKSPLTTDRATTRDDRALGIYTRPTASWRKVLHALDNDVYLIYRAPVSGKYTLRLTAVTNEEHVGAAGRRWREKGHVPGLTPLPAVTPWPDGTTAPVAIHIRPIPIGSAAEQERLRTYLEVEPNDTPELAQTIPVTQGSGDTILTYEITGGADDIEFFDNGRVGQSGDDWFRIEYRGREPRLLTAQLSLPGQTIAARIRAYRLKEPPANRRTTVAEYLAGTAPLLAIEEYREGQDQNERVHQQEEEHRANICRLLKPGETYFLRVEANAPGYQLQLRTVKPAPYTDPRMAVRQAIYTHIGQVDAWLTNRPRGASLERRIRDTGNLLGTNCMSCHTQSGVWGPAVPFQNGYRPENVQNYWHLITVMYECLRPTNELKDAANNTSLAPLDLGDGPAGTRAAGFNIVHAERVIRPRKLHAKMQIRTANYVMQTADPGGINAAGPGSNIGRVIVAIMASEILKKAWETTGDPKYFRKLEEKARNVLNDNVQYTDDVALRLHYFHRVLPIKDYPALAATARRQEQASGQKPQGSAAEIQKFVEAVRAQLQQDEARLRAIQNADGSWGFHPGNTPDGGRTWKPGEAGSDPAPTALGILGLSAAGHGPDDPAIARAVKALLAMQDPTGRWNRAAQTGFVTTAYALHALSRLYPVTPERPARARFTPRKGETLLQTLQRVQALALTADPQLTDLMLQAARHESPPVRYWALIGLGAVSSPEGVPVVLHALADRSKMVRDAATWALRQLLLDDRGWNETLTAFEKGNDDTRAQIAQALNMRADAVMPKASLSWPRFVALMDRAMNRDPHPAVRAWAMKAAWQWWVWNPPVRSGLNRAWITLLERPESSALVEHCLRYSSHALFIANGHKANGSNEHQYRELAALFEAISRRFDTLKDSATRDRLARRLVGIGGTFYELAGADGGPGQMGYVTPGAGEMMGKAALHFLQSAVRRNNLALVRAGIEGGSNVPYQPLTAFLVDYSLKGPEELRQLAAEAVGDPRSARLAAVPEQIEPQMAQIRRGAMEPARRSQISDPILKLWARVNWVVPPTREQQRNFFNILIPRFERYLSPEEIAAIPDPARRAEAEREMDAAWYLADRLGEVLQQNTDLHLEIVFREYFPAQFRNPLEAHFWLRSVEWLLTFNPAMQAPAPAGAQNIAFRQNTSPDAHQPDVALTIKDRALQLYLDQLKPTAPPRTRALAIRMANKTALRSNPEVLRALSEVLTFEKDRDLRQIIENVLKQSNEKFLPELIAFLKQEKHPSVRFDASGEPVLTKEQTEDILYFRDYVMPELSRQKRSDQQSCMGCHGVVGRVPSYYMKPPDQFGYISVPDLMFNYRVVQQKVDLANIAQSKLLRKPLNVQDGTEDGHQGGRRYSPTDEGYLILKRWAENQPRVLRPDTSASRPAEAQRTTRLVSPQPPAATRSHLHTG
ncbi:MAG: HEAT repeat domain-containing protein [Chloroherpetonaceae bacterium]|nr:HEAT repeat domain-containing protein [Chthonomonadaceae bacterium]MDW8207703.1 HEAT repeat domain-containing protein [Chloroherpetonaceae bacterium]